MKNLLVFLFCFFSIVNCQPIGKYCGSNFFVSNLDIKFEDKNYLDCSVKIFGVTYNCTKEVYNFTNNSLIFPNKSDCLHKTLSKFGQQEPMILYNKTLNQLLVYESGFQITLKSC